jgi:hypothetical protein
MRAVFKKILPVFQKKRLLSARILSMTSIFCGDIHSFIPVVANCMPVSYKWTLKCMQNVGKALMETIHCTLKANFKDMLQLF